MHMYHRCHVCYVCEYRAHSKGNHLIFLVRPSKISNSNYVYQQSTMKFTPESSLKTINFLFITVNKERDGSLSTSLS